MIETSTKLKSLQTQEKRLTALIESLKTQLSGINKELTSAEFALREVLEQKKDIASSEDIILSEHAVVRYLERTGQINLQELQEELLTDEFIQQVKALGNGTYPFGNLRAVVRNGVIVTVK